MKRPFIVNWKLDEIDKAVSSLKDYVAELEKAVEDKHGKIEPLDAFPPAPSFILVERYSHYRFDNEVFPAKARELLAEWLEKCRLVRETNAPRIENNKKVHEEATLYMKGIGMATTVGRHVTSKRGKSSYVHEDSGWVTSLGGIQRTDRFDDIERTYKGLVGQVDLFEKKLAESTRTREAAEKKTQAAATVHRLMGKYSIEPTLDFREVLDEFITRTNYYSTLCNELHTDYKVLKDALLLLGVYD